MYEDYEDIDDKMFKDMQRIKKKDRILNDFLLFIYNYVSEKCGGIQTPAFSSLNQINLEALSYEEKALVLHRFPNLKELLYYTPKFMDKLEMSHFPMPGNVLFDPVDELVDLAIQAVAVRIKNIHLYPELAKAKNDKDLSEASLLLDSLPDL
jgi:hypothetical protein